MASTAMLHVAVAASILLEPGPVQPRAGAPLLADVVVAVVAEVFGHPAPTCVTLGAVSVRSQVRVGPGKLPR